MSLYKHIELKDKIAIIQAAETESVHAIAKRTKRSRKAIQKILKNKETYLHAVEVGKCQKLKTVKKPKFRDIDASMIAWVKNIRSQNETITGDLMKVREF